MNDRFSVKEASEILTVSRQSLEKALKNTPNTLEKIEGSTKKVKVFLRVNFPKYYKDMFDEKLGKLEEENDTNILDVNFSRKYLLAPKHKREEAVLKCRLIDFSYEKIDNISLKKWLKRLSHEFDPIRPISEAKFFRWRNAYEEARLKGIHPVDAMLDNRGSKKGSITLTDEHKKQLAHYFITDANINMNTIYKKMCNKFGDTTPSSQTLRRYYKQWKKDNLLMYEFAKDPDGFKNKFMPALGNASEKAKHKNHFWELDSTPADVITSDGKRMAVVAMIDIFSRRTLFHLAKSSSSYTISQMLRLAIIKYGIPDNVVVDNGADYQSNHFESICHGLKINIITVPPFSGDAKPHVERVFKTMSHQLFEQLPGYIGHSVADRSALQARQSFAHKIQSKQKFAEEKKIKTDEDRAAFEERWKKKNSNKDEVIEIPLTAKELQTWLNKWNENIYEQSLHRGIKTTPIKKWNSCPMPVKQIPDEKMLDLLLGELTKRSVNKKGIHLDGVVYAHPELALRVKERVFVIAPDDLGYLSVYDGDMNFICIAEDPSKLGNSRAHAKEAKSSYNKFVRKMSKAVNVARAHEDDSYMDVIENAKELIKPQTTAVKKSAPRIDQLIKDNEKMVAADEELLEKSTRYDFTKKDKEGIPQKLTPSGRPAFTQLYDRFLWDMENDRVDENTKKLASKHANVWSMANKEFERRKTS